MRGRFLALAAATGLTLGLIAALGVHEPTSNGGAASNATVSDLAHHQRATSNGTTIEW